MIAVPGDLDQTRLGLTLEAFNQLAAECDAVFHCGAWVNFIFPYSTLERANVQGTHEALRLACCLRPKVFHFVSTLGVLTSSDFSHEPFPSGSHQGLSSGYARTKWVAEQLVHQAATRGLPVTIFRPGRVMGNLENGSSNPDDMFARMLIGFAQLQALPASEGVVDIIPVDYLCRAMVALAGRAECQGRAFHFFNPRPMAWSQLTQVFHDLGYVVNPLPYERWREVLTQQVKRRPEHALAPFLHLFGERPPVQKMCRQGDANTHQFLSETNIECPPVDGAMLRSYLTWFINQGSLAPPVRN